MQAGKSILLKMKKVKVDVSVKKSWIDSDKKDLENYPTVLKSDCIKTKIK